MRVWIAGTLGLFVFAQTAVAQRRGILARLEPDSDWKPVSVATSGSTLALIAAVRKTGAIIQTTDGAIAFIDVHGIPVATTAQNPDKTLLPGSIAAAGWIGDTLWVSDPKGRKIVRFSSSGRMLSATDWPVRLVLANGGDAPFAQASMLTPPRAIGLAGDGSMLLSVYLPDGASVPSAWHRPPGSSTAIVRVSGKGQLQNVIGWTPASPESCTASFGAGSVLDPLCPIPRSAVAADGTLVVYTIPNVTGPDSGTVRVVAIGNRGDTVFSARVPFSQVELSAQSRDSIVRATLARMGAPVPSLDAALRSVVSKMLPPVYSVFVGVDHSIWVQQAPDADTRRWTILDDHGRLWAQLTVPSRIRILTADLNTVWATDTNQAGFSSILRYKLRYKLLH